jgi:Tfp pilus assembly protein PilF
VLLTVRQRLGESRAAIRERQAPLPRVTTASLEALRSYAEGSAAWRVGKYPLAREHWRRAVDLDTGFAMALGSLGSWSYQHNDREAGERYYAEALRRSERLTEWEQLRLLASVAGYRGHRDSSIALSRVIATRFPNVENWYNYGTGLMRNDRDAEAITALETALTFDSLHVGTHINLATASKGLTRNEDALRHYRRAHELDSTVMYRNNINHEWGGTFVRLGRLQEAEQLFQRMLGSERLADRALGMRSMGYLALWQGQLGRAIDFFSQATDATAQLQQVLSEARNRLLLAMALRAADRSSEANAHVTRALALSSSRLIPPQALVFVAFGCMRLGRIADADSVLRLFRSRLSPENVIDRDAESLAAAALHLARQQPDSALALLRWPMPNSPIGYVMTLRAEAFQALGVSDSARATLERLIGEPLFGVEGQDEWQHAPLTLGTLLETMGDTAGAVTAYRQYLDRWRDAPAALSRLASAQSRIAALGKR